MPRKFEKVGLAEFERRVQQFVFTRTVDAVHLHHTYRPNHAGFNGEQSIIGMWRYHTEKNGWSDIAQHVTVDPSGFIWMGRDWNRAPASATGHNGTAQSGPFMIEVIGDFDRGKDVFTGRQRAVTLGVIAAVQDRFGLPSRSLRFHREFSSKSCPGDTLDWDDIVCEMVAVRRGAVSRSRARADSAPAVIEPLGCGENGSDPTAAPRRAAHARSSTTGGGAPRHRALCVGVNAYPESPLTGCVNDASEWATLFAMHGFEVETLFDEEATWESVLGALRRMVAATLPGEVTAFAFSGHGTLVYDTDGDEARRNDPTPLYDEAILPIDHARGALILDDDLDAVFAELKPGAHARVFIDACHSGFFRQFSVRVPLAPAGSARARFVPPTDRMLGRHEAFRRALAPRPPRGEPSAGIVAFSACESYQLAWEVDGRGVFSAAAQRILLQRADLSNKELALRLIEEMRPDGRQSPVLDCGPEDENARALPSLVGAETPVPS